MFALTCDERRDAAERRLLGEQASQFRLGLLCLGHVARQRIDQADVMIRRAGPLEPAVAAVAAAPSVLERPRLPSRHDRRILCLGRLAIIRVHKAQERLAQQLGARVPENALERGIHACEVAGEVGHAQHVQR
jgi:hypothetical protein